MLALPILSMVLHGVGLELALRSHLATSPYLSSNLNIHSWRIQDPMVASCSPMPFLKLQFLPSPLGMLGDW